MEDTAQQAETSEVDKKKGKPVDDEEVMGVCTLSKITESRHL